MKENAGEPKVYFASVRWSLYNRTDNIIENISKLQEVVEDINVK